MDTEGLKFFPDLLKGIRGFIALFLQVFEEYSSCFPAYIYEWMEWISEKVKKNS
jgi:hypothetical protein